MTWLEALILGLLQGLTEFLPVSSSGHLEIAYQLFGIEEDNLRFTVIVHGATALATIVVFWQEIIKLFRGGTEFKWNPETRYISMIMVSMIPILIVGLFFRTQVESIFESDRILWIVGGALLLTAVLLTFAHFNKDGQKDIGFRDAFIIGLAQVVAIIPGLSRSGTTIATGLLLGNKRAAVAQFSFLMILIPILGETVLDMIRILTGSVTEGGEATLMVLGIGFLAAFVAGLFACKFMINLVKKGKLIHFAIYCVIAATVAFML